MPFRRLGVVLLAALLGVIVSVAPASADDPNVLFTKFVGGATCIYAIGDICRRLLVT